MLRNDSESENEEEGYYQPPIDNEDGNSEVPERDPDVKDD